MATQDQIQPSEDAFPKETVEIFQLFENQTLSGVDYYTWRHENGEFLYTLALSFENAGTLMLAANEESSAIRLIEAEEVNRNAQKLQEMHGHTVIRKLNAAQQPLWQGCVDFPLVGIRLSRQEDGFYRNDVLLLEFVSRQILLQLNPQHGLDLFEYEFE